MSQTPRTDAGTITIKVGAETWVVCRLDVAAEMERELAAARAENEALQKRVEHTDRQLSRVLHELAGSASMCWSETPKGEFDSSQALKHVEDAINELRGYLRDAALIRQEPQR